MIQLRNKRTNYTNVINERMNIIDLTVVTFKSSVDTTWSYFQEKRVFSLNTIVLYVPDNFSMCQS